MPGPGLYGATRSDNGHVGRDTWRLYWPGTDDSNGIGRVKGHIVIAATPIIKNRIIETTGVRIPLLRKDKR